ncbi:unnamed protein product [Orchesella dallaii]|uniref:Kinesin motor domain-containing protein n=1 Tax=Orchesella dallaii TaxID=48710 RepID=A0ABP1PNN4_9HEXA
MDKSTSPPPAPPHLAARANANNNGVPPATTPPSKSTKHDGGSSGTLRGSGSYPSMIRARTANRKITKRSESVSLPMMMMMTGGSSSSTTTTTSHHHHHDRNRSSSKKLRRMVYSKASRRKSLEQLGLLRRNRCGTAKLQWPSEKKETDAFDLLPEGCLQVRQLRLKSGNSRSFSQSANNDEDDEQPDQDGELEQEYYYQENGELASRNDDQEEIICSQEKGNGIFNMNGSVSSLLQQKNNQGNHRNSSGFDWKSKKNISVLVRIRPKQGRELEEKTIIFRTDAKTIVFDPKEKTKDFYFQGVKQSTRNDFGRKRPNKNISFHYDKVYGPESSNLEIFKDSLANLTDHLMEGYNCTVFAYGSTGSGKTYTMIGSGSPPNPSPGLTVLMVESIYKRIAELSEDHDCEIIVSYLEVYNETIKDLLHPEKELSIREDGKRGIIIPELSHYKPRDPSELLKLLRRGNLQRTQHATDQNHESSRSHAVFEVKLCLKKVRQIGIPGNLSSKRDGADENCNYEDQDEFIDEETNKVEVIHSKLVMVDLAGSERGAGATYDGARQREGASINKSLLALANCISALADGKAHIPYRNSKLTRLLKDALSGNCTTIMIANIAPSAITSEDTYNTLKYAERAKSIVGPGSKQNMFLEDLMQEDCVKSQVAELQAKLAQLEELLEEKLKHEMKQREETSSTDEKIEFLMHFGDGDGPDTNVKKYLNKNNNDANNDEQRDFDMGNRSKFEEEEIPNEIKKYIDKTTEWGHQFSAFVDKAHKARWEEWTMFTTKLKVDTADFFGRLPVGDTNYVEFAKLKNEVVKLERKEEEMEEGLIDDGKRKEPLKSVLELRTLTRQMDTMEKEFKNTLKGQFSSCGRGQAECDGDGDSVVDCDNKRGPRVSISLEEFLQFKRMLGEREASRKVEHSYHIFSQQINSQLMSSGMILLHALKLVRNMWNTQLQTKAQIPKEIQADYQQLLQLVYGPEDVVSTVLDRLLLSPPPPPLQSSLKVHGSADVNNNDLKEEPSFGGGNSMSNSLQSRRSSQLIMDDFHNLAKLVERPLLTALSTSTLLEKEEVDDLEVKTEAPAVSAGNSTLRLSEQNPNDGEREQEQQEIGAGDPFFISTTTQNIYEPPLLSSGESPENDDDDDDDDGHSENDHDPNLVAAEESSSSESLIPFYDAFIPETEPEFMPHNNTAWSVSPSTITTAFAEKERKGSSFEIRFESEKQSWDRGNGSGGRKSFNGLRRFPVKSNSISSKAAGLEESIVSSSSPPPPLRKQKVSEKTSREVGTSTSSNCDLENEKEETIEQRSKSVLMLKQDKSIGKKRLVDQARVIKDHQLSKKDSTSFCGLPQNQEERVNPSVDIKVGVGPAPNSNNKKGFVPLDHHHHHQQQHQQAKSLRRLKSSRITSEETLIGASVGSSKSKTNTKTQTTNPNNPFRGQHQNTKAEISSEKRKLKLSQLIPGKKAASTSSGMNNSLRNSNNSSVALGVRASGIKLRGAGSKRTPPEFQMDHLDHQGQPKNPHHQYLLRHQERLKVNAEKKSISQSQQQLNPPPLIHHHLNLIPNQKEQSCEEENERNDPHDTEYMDNLEKPERKRRNPEKGLVPESARSSISHKAPYHTSSKTFTIREHDHTLLPLASVPIISARSNNSDDEDETDNNNIPLEVIYKREQKPGQAGEEGGEGYSSNEDEQDDEDHHNQDDDDEENEEDNDASDNNNDDDDDSSTASYSES